MNGKTLFVMLAALSLCPVIFPAYSYAQSVSMDADGAERSPCVACTGMQHIPLHALSPHAPIRINKDADFTPTNGVTGGIGTAGDPYIISNWYIDCFNYTGITNGTGIYISNTTSHVIVENCYILNAKVVSMPYSSGDAIFLSKVKNCIIRNCVMRMCENGLSAGLLSGSVIQNNVIAYNVRGIGGSSINNVNFTNNYIDSNIPIGMELTYCSNLNIYANEVCYSYYCIRMNNVDSSVFIGNKLWGGGNGAHVIVDCNYNKFAYNDLNQNADWAVQIEVGNDYNSFYMNKFNSNNVGKGTSQVKDDSKNLWNTSGSPHGYGNYWSDWKSPDSDSNGIVDLPYALNGTGGAMDYFPLVTPPPVPVPERLHAVAVSIASLIAVPSLIYVQYALCAQRRMQRRK